MSWVYLIAAGLLETAWTIGLKQSDSFHRLWPSAWTVATALASFGLLSLALRTLPVGTAYAVWTSLGAATTAIVGMLFLGEPRGALRLAAIVLIVAGEVGLQLSHGAWGDGGI